MTSGRSKAITRSPDVEQTLTHGGKRSGAGRPKQVDKPIRRTVYLDQRHIELIERCQERHMWRLGEAILSHQTFSQALRGVLDEALEKSLVSG